DGCIIGRLGADEELFVSASSRLISQELLQNGWRELASTATAMGKTGQFYFGCCHHFSSWHQELNATPDTGVVVLPSASTRVAPRGGERFSSGFDVCATRRAANGEADSPERLVARNTYPR